MSQQQQQQQQVQFFRTGRKTTSAGKVPRNAAMASMKQPISGYNDNESESAADEVVKNQREALVNMQSFFALDRSLDDDEKHKYCIQTDDEHPCIGSVVFDNERCIYCREESRGMYFDQDTRLKRCRDCHSAADIQVFCSGCDLIMTTDFLRITPELALARAHVFCSKQCQEKLLNRKVELPIYLFPFQRMITMKFSLSATVEDVIKKCIEYCYDDDDELYKEEMERIDEYRMLCYFNPSVGLYHAQYLMNALGSDLTPLPLIFIDSNQLKSDFDQQKDVVRYVPDEFVSQDTDLFNRVDKIPVRFSNRYDLYSGEPLEQLASIRSTDKPQQQQQQQAQNVDVEEIQQPAPPVFSLATDYWTTEQLCEWLEKYGIHSLPPRGEQLFKMSNTHDGSYLIVQIPEAVYQEFVHLIPRENVSGVRRSRENSTSIDTHTRFLVLHRPSDASDDWCDDLFNEIALRLCPPPEMRATVLRKRGVKPPVITDLTFREPENRDADLPWSWCEILHDFEERGMLKVVASTAASQKDEKWTTLLQFLRKHKVYGQVRKSALSDGKSFLCTGDSVIIPFNIPHVLATDSVQIGDAFWCYIDFSDTSFAAAAVAKEFDSLDTQEEQAALLMRISSELQTDKKQQEAVDIFFDDNDVPPESGSFYRYTEDWFPSLNRGTGVIFAVDNVDNVPAELDHVVFFHRAFVYIPLKEWNLAQRDIRRQRNAMKDDAKFLRHLVATYCGKGKEELISESGDDDSVPSNDDVEGRRQLAKSMGVPMVDDVDSPTSRLLKTPVKRDRMENDNAGREEQELEQQVPALQARRKLDYDVDPPVNADVVPLENVPPPLIDDSEYELLQRKHVPSPRRYVVHGPETFYVPLIATDEPCDRLIWEKSTLKCKAAMDRERINMEKVSRTRLQVTKECFLQKPATMDTERVDVVVQKPATMTVIKVDTVVRKAKMTIVKVVREIRKAVMEVLHVAVKHRLPSPKHVEAKRSKFDEIQEPEEPVEIKKVGKKRRPNRFMRLVQHLPEKRIRKEVKTLSPK